MTTSPMEDWFYRFWSRLIKDDQQTAYALERQYPIGPYYADFSHIGTQTIIENDGKAYHSSKEQMLADLKRQAQLEAQDWTVLRFSGAHVRNHAVQCVQVVRKHITTQREKRGDAA